MPNERVEQKIFIIRGQKVMLDRHLAELYGVSTKVLNQAVRRNIARFPEDFMFQLTKLEMENWKSQFVTSNSDKMGYRKLPLVFTEYGVAMLSSVLSSEQAIMTNIQIIRAFGRLREMASHYHELRLRIEAMEKQYDEHFREVFTALRQLLAEPESPKEEIGFRHE